MQEGGLCIRNWQFEEKCYYNGPKGTITVHLVYICCKWPEYVEASRAKFSILRMSLWTWSGTKLFGHSRVRVFKITTIYFSNDIICSIEVFMLSCNCLNMTDIMRQYQPRHNILILHFSLLIIPDLLIMWRGFLPKWYFLLGPSGETWGRGGVVLRTRSAKMFLFEPTTRPICNPIVITFIIQFFLKLIVSVTPNFAKC